MHRRRLPHITLSSLLGLLVAAGCGGGEEADPDAVNQRLREMLPGLVDPTSQSIEFAGESTALAGLGDSMAAIDESLNLPFSISPVDLSSDGEAVAVALPDGEDSGEDVAETLAERLFTAENYEGDGVYRIPLDMVCPADEETGEVDPDCVRQWERAELRIKAEIVDDGVDFTLLVGPDRSAPLTLELRSSRITVVVDLGETADAIRFLAPEAELPDVLEGVVAFSLVVNGPADVSFEIAVREATRVEADTADGGRIRFSTEAKDPLASLRIEVAARRLTALFDLGRTQLSMPNQMNDDSSLAGGVWSIDWRGLSFTATAEDGADQIVIDNIGLGDDTSTIKLDDTQLVGIDLNPGDGRRARLTLRPDPAGGLPIATFEPGLEILIDVFLQPLADAGDLVDPWLLDDRYRIALAGDAPATQSIAPDEAAGTPGALRVARGQLAIESETASVTVSTGQCLLADALSEGEHPLLGGLTAGPCP